MHFPIPSTIGWRSCPPIRFAHKNRMPRLSWKCVSLFCAATCCMESFSLYVDSDPSADTQFGTSCCAPYGLISKSAELTKHVLDDRYVTCKFSVKIRSLLSRSLRIWIWHVILTPLLYCDLCMQYVARCAVRYLHSTASQVLIRLSWFLKSESDSGIVEITCRNYRLTMSWASSRFPCSKVPRIVFQKRRGNEI